MNYYIKPREWEYIFRILQERNDINNANEAKLRMFLEAIYYIVRTGCQWRMLPCFYGKWGSIHKRFKRWNDKGVWSDLFEKLKDEPDTENMIIDTTIVRAHACSSGYKKNSQEEQALGRSKGGFSCKIHTLVDALGNPLKFLLTAGQRNDIIKAEELIKNTSNTTVIADKGYDANALIGIIANQNSVTVIPPKKNRKVQREYDNYLYKERHLIECFFGKIKHFRRIFSRFDKTATAFMGFLHFVGALIWLR